MIKTPLSTVIGGAFWTPGATTIGAFGTKKTLNQIIKSLFTNNEQGFAYDPNDLTTMFQDAAGTVPVTDAGQAVGLMLDKSGRNNHAFQTVSASRPILQRNATTGAYYLAFDGADDFLVTNSIDFTATDKVSLFAGVTSLININSIISELSADANLNHGSFNLSSIVSGGTLGYSTLSRGTATVSSTQSAYNAYYPPPHTAILSIKHDISGNLSSMRRNGVVGINGTGDKGTGNFGNHPLFIGRRTGASYPFNGHIYSLISIGRLTTDVETAALEKLIAKNTGVALSV